MSTTSHANNLNSIDSEYDMSKIDEYTDRDWLVFDGSLNYNSLHTRNIGWIEKLLPIIDGP